MNNSRDSIKDVWGTPAPYHGAWSERVDERKTEAAESWIQSACVLCSNRCGLEIGVKEGRIVGVRGRADDHVNRGRLGPKGLHGWEANNSNDRLTTPLIRKNGKLERASWDEAMNLIIEKTETDAEGLGLASGDLVRLESRRGVIAAAVRIGGIRPGHIFVPFHYGYWDDDSQSRAANELTNTEWDPVSKQPHFKYSAVRITKVEADSESEGFRQIVANAKEAIVEMKDALVGSNEDTDSQKHVAEYLGLLKEAEHEIARAFASVAHHHVDEPDIFETCQYFAQVSRVHAQVVEEFTSIYGEASDHEASRVKDSIFQGPRSGGFGLVRDLHDLLLLTTEAHLGWMVLLQTSQALRDKEFIAACTKLGGETDGQRWWLQTRIKQAAPQALLVDI